VRQCWEQFCRSIAKGYRGFESPLSATQSALFTYNLEMAANPRVAWPFHAQCEPEKAISVQIG
jgi:hypothetical protein